MLKIVRTPSSLRTGATFFIAGWWLGANMKPMPVSSMHARDLRRASGRCCSAERLQHVGAAATCSTRCDRRACDLRAGRRGDEHRRGRDVEGVRAVAAGADDVDQVRACRRTSTLVANSRITCAAAVISPIVSFFTRRPMMHRGHHHRRHLAAHDQAHQRRASRRGRSRGARSCAAALPAGDGMTLYRLGSALSASAGNCAATRGRARSGSIRDGTARPRPAASRWRTPMISPSSRSTR